MKDRNDKGWKFHRFDSNNSTGEYRDLYVDTWKDGRMLVYETHRNCVLRRMWRTYCERDGSGTDGKVVT